MGRGTGWGVGRGKEEISSSFPLLLKKRREGAKRIGEGKMRGGRGRGKWWGMGGRGEVKTIEGTKGHLVAARIRGGEGGWFQGRGMMNKIAHARFSHVSRVAVRTSRKPLSSRWRRIVDTILERARKVARVSSVTIMSR
eukprot:361514-Chlamydomonas_euryale.AAC.1